MIYLLEVDPGLATWVESPFERWMKSFKDRQRANWEDLGVSLDLTKDLTYSFGRDMILFSNRITCTPTEFLSDAACFAGEAWKTFVNEHIEAKPRSHVGRLNVRDYLHRFVNDGQLCLYLQVPESQMAEVLSRIPGLRSIACP